MEKSAENSNELGETNIINTEMCTVMGKVVSRNEDSHDVDDKGC